MEKKEDMLLDTSGLKEKSRRYVEEVNKRLKEKEENKKYKTIDLRKGEPDFRELKKGDVNQLYIRSLADISMALMHIKETLYVLTQDYEILAKKQGIDLYEERVKLTQKAVDELQKDIEENK